MERKSSLKIVLWDFFKIGAMGFGGSMAILALMERELVRKRKIVSLEEFLHGVAISQLLGSFSVNTAIFIGTRLFGIVGGMLSAFFFMLPSITIVIILSWLYFSFHTLPSLQTAFSGLAPVVVALILAAAFSIGKKSLISFFSYIIAFLSVFLSLYKVSSYYILLVLGGMGILRLMLKEKKYTTHTKFYLFTPIFLLGDNIVPMLGLFLRFLRIGLIYFGGGFALVPVLHEQLVTQLKWLTEREFIDGVAISNLTPGPIAVLATFVGYKAYGFLGAMVSTTALFIPSGILTILLTKGYHLFRGYKFFKAFLEGVVPAVVGLLITAAIKLLPKNLPSVSYLILLVVALVLLIRYKWHPAIVLAIGAFMGVLGFLE